MKTFVAVTINGTGDLVTLHRSLRPGAVRYAKFFAMYLATMSKSCIFAAYKLQTHTIHNKTDKTVHHTTYLA